MAQQPLGPPPKIDTGPVFDRWMNSLWNRIAVTGQILWTQIIKPTVVKNTFFAGPTTGADAQADFRAVVAADLGTGTANSSTFLRGDLTWNAPSGSGDGTTNNVISIPTTIDADKSYMVVGYLTIEETFTNNGNVGIF